MNRLGLYSDRIQIKNLQRISQQDQKTKFEQNPQSQSTSWMFLQLYPDHESTENLSSKDQNTQEDCERFSTYEQSKIAIHKLNSLELYSDRI